MQTYVKFKKSMDPIFIEVISDLLKEEGLDYKKTESNSSSHESNDYIGSNPFEFTIGIEVTNQSEGKAKQVVSQYFNREIEKLSHNHYLFEMTLEELGALVKYPLKWNPFDVEMARVLLDQQ